MATSDGRLRYDRRLEWLGAWSGIVWVFVCGAGFGSSGLLPAKAASTSPEVLAAYLSDHKYQILIGMLLVLIGGYTFLMTWSITLAYQVKKYANPSPIAFYILLFVGLNGAILGMMTGLVGSAMAFRVDTQSPATTQLLFDLIWFLFLLPWPPFMLWQMVAGFAILSRTNSGVMFPRWTGYFTLWVGAMGEMFSALSVFYYYGPFSYNGLVTFWIPGAAFFVWVLVMAIVQVRNWKHVKDGIPDSETVAYEIDSANSAVPDVGEADSIRVAETAGI